MAGKIIEVFGDATKPQTSSQTEKIFIPHVCNDIGAWGAGFVLALSKMSSFPEYMYQRTFQRHKLDNYLGIVSFAPIPETNITVCNMIAQHKTKSADNPRPLDYSALTTCMINVADEVLQEQNKGSRVRIHCPKFGGDLAGGNWDFILCLIEDIWLAEEIDVVVYEWTNDKSKWGSTGKYPI